MGWEFITCVYGGDDDDDDDVTVDGISNKAGSVDLNVPLRRVRLTRVAMEKQ